LVEVFPIISTYIAGELSAIFAPRLSAQGRTGGSFHTYCSERDMKSSDLVVVLQRKYRVNLHQNVVLPQRFYFVYGFLP
jgi:hypothetical protein